MRCSIMLAVLLALPIAPARAGEKADEDKILAQANLMSQAFAIIAKRVNPAVVNITTEGGGEVNREMELLQKLFPHLGRNQGRVQVGQGSGVIADPRGYILTNHHVIKNANTIMVKLSDGREFEAELVGSDPDSDIAVLKIEAEKLTIAALGDSNNCVIGEWVMAIGNPFGLDSSVSSGIISARGRSGVGIVEYEDFIQTDAAINPGNSGGALVNLKGEVIGINTAIISKAGGYNGIGFTIPINIARVIMNELIANKKVTRSYLGVGLEPLTPDLVAAFGLESTRGALVTEVMKNTPAAKAGIQRGDVILAYGKQLVSDDHHMRNMVATTATGETVKVTLVRKGKKMVVDVKLEAVPEQIEIARKSKKVIEDLGIEIVELNDELRDRLGYEKGAWGVLVSAVRRGSTAARIQLRPGSLILKIDEQEVRTADECLAALGKGDLKKGMVLLWRTGRYFHPPVKLSSND